MSPSTELHHRYIEPLDVLLLRGNQAFGDPGSYGEALMPPWPSVAAGAIRSRMLSDARIDLGQFAQGQCPHPVLGTPAEPGAFTLHALHLARQRADGRTELLLPAPADLLVQERNGKPHALPLQPTALPSALLSSNPLPQLPVLAQDSRGKTSGGWWLTQAGWQQYLLGHTPAAEHWVKASQLWQYDERVGVGLAASTRSAEDGRLFTTRAVAMRPGVGFVASVSGVPGDQLPASGLLRLGGDGRAARIGAAQLDWPEPDWQAISQQGRCRLVLSSGGLFTQGWLPNGMQADGAGRWRFDLHGVRARLVAASVTRSETVSGWDLAAWQPKPAERMAPAGSVYWLEDVQASPESLRKLVMQGLWSDPCEDAQRRAEGFNRLSLAAFPR